MGASSSQPERIPSWPLVAAVAAVSGAVAAAATVAVTMRHQKHHDSSEILPKHLEESSNLNLTPIRNVKALPAAEAIQPHQLPSVAPGTPGATVPSCQALSAATPAASRPLYSPVQLRRDPRDPRPREGALDWDTYFMALAFLTAQRSKDPNKQVGAVIVGTNKVVIGCGYNGFPRGCSDVVLPWAKKSGWHSACGDDGCQGQEESNPLGTKYPYVVHAEANALLNKNSASVEGATVYVTMFPCNECAKLLIQAGIREVVYHEGKVEELVGSCSTHASFSFDQASTSTHGSKTVSYNKQSSAASEQGSDTQVQGDQEAGAVDFVISSRHSSLQGEQRQLQGLNKKGSLDPAAVQYLASMKLLRLAGVSTRQHQLSRTIILPG